MDGWAVGSLDPSKSIYDRVANLKSQTLSLPSFNTRRVSGCLDEKKADHLTLRSAEVGVGKERETCRGKNGNIEGAIDLLRTNGIA